MLRVDVASDQVRYPVTSRCRVPTSPDHAALRRRLAAIRNLATEMEPLAAAARLEYAGSPTVRRAVERLIQLAVDAITGAADMNLKEAGRVPSDTESEALAQVRELGVIPQRLMGELAQAIGLRDHLIQDYQRIDDKRVLTASGELVRWAREYVAATEAWLSKHEGPEK